MKPRSAAVLVTLALALGIVLPALPAADAAAPALCQADLASPATEAAPAFPPLAPEAQAAGCQQQCDQLCAPLQGRCKAGSCFCLRDPL